VGYEILLDGDEHWLEPRGWPGWLPPHLEAKEFVEVEGVPAPDALESPEVRMVVDESPKLEAVWGVEQGWPSFCNMMSKLGELLDVKIVTQQRNVVGADWHVTSRHYSVRLKGEPVEGL
jgi:hypothetical protein